MVEVLIPYAGDCPHRARALEWVRSRLPWPVTIAPGRQPWSKGAAVMPAAHRSAADVVVIHDADVWADGIHQAVEQVTAGAPWAIPHRGVFRLTEQSTTAAIAGAPWHDLEIAERPYGGVIGGGIVVIHRALLLACPLDPRFIGWGGEDEAWGMALTTTLGPPARIKGPLVHLFHPPQQRVTRRRGSTANTKLRNRYATATRSTAEMADLLEEARHALSDLLTKPCTITRRSPSTTTDDYGNVIPATATVTTVCELQQLIRRADAEAPGHGDLSDTQWLLVLPAGTAIDTNDKVTANGQAFEVVGAPWPARHPRTGEEHHIEVNLRRVAAATDS